MKILAVILLTMAFWDIIGTLSMICASAKSYSWLHVAEVMLTKRGFKVMWELVGDILVIIFIVGVIG